MSAVSDTSSGDHAPAKPAAPTVDMVEADGAIVVRLGGAWETAFAAEIFEKMRRYVPPQGSAVRFDFTALETFDTTGALIVYHALKRLEAAGIAADVSQAPERVAALL